MYVYYLIVTLYIWDGLSPCTFGTGMSVWIFFVDHVSSGAFFLLLFYYWNFNRVSCSTSDVPFHEWSSDEVFWLYLFDNLR